MINIELFLLDYVSIFFNLWKIDLKITHLFQIIIHILNKLR